MFEGLLSAVFGVKGQISPELLRVFVALANDRVGVKGSSWTEAGGAAADLHWGWGGGSCRLTSPLRLHEGSAAAAVEQYVREGSEKGSLACGT